MIFPNREFDYGKIGKMDVGRLGEGWNTENAHDKT